MDKEQTFRSRIVYEVSIFSILGLPRESFQLLIYPGTVGEAMVDVWPASYSLKWRCKLSCRTKWEISGFSRRFPRQQRLGGIMTITTESKSYPLESMVNAQATSCHDYICLHWPVLGPFILEAVQYIVYTSLPGKTTCRILFINGR